MTALTRADAEDGGSRRIKKCQDFFLIGIRGEHGEGSGGSVGMGLGNESLEMSCQKTGWRETMILSRG